MKLSKTGSASLFLLCAALVPALICIKTGRTKTAMPFLVTAFGCGIMLYASSLKHGKRKK